MPPASAAVGGVRRFFDIAVPRNISSDVNDCGASAHVYNVDDLKEVRRDTCACTVHHPVSREVSLRAVVWISLPICYRSGAEGRRQCGLHRRLCCVGHG